LPRFAMPFSVYRQTKNSTNEMLSSRSVSPPVSRSVPVRKPPDQNLSIGHGCFISFASNKEAFRSGCEIMITFTGQGLRGPNPRGASQDGRWSIPSLSRPAGWTNHRSASSPSLCIDTAVRAQLRPPFLCRLAMICTTYSVARPLLVPSEPKVPAQSYEPPPDAHSVIDGVRRAAGRPE
jgi:hypothetical protein